VIGFDHYLTEAFDTPYKYSGGKKYNDEYEYTFQTEDGGKVTVVITGSEHPDDYDEYDWTLSFFRQKSGSQVTRFDTTGEGDAMRIFSTVLAVTKDFLKKENPKYISFGAEKSKDTGTKQLQSREKLYLRMAKKYFSGKYTIRVQAGSRESLFFMTRKGK
jgi:hypothetical protein|tara:strand:- start:540 stop:1019 length:480 start_codon:yes stop_codon:yes gene_type:complete